LSCSLEAKTKKTGWQLPHRRPVSEETYPPVYLNYRQWDSSKSNTFVNFALNLDRFTYHWQLAITALLVEKQTNTSLAA